MNADELALWAEARAQSAGPTRAALAAEGSPLLIPLHHLPLPLWPLTKRDELSFRRVLALPKASIAGLASMI